MKLIQISPNDTVTASVVNAMMTVSPVLQDAEFYGITGNAEYLRKAATADGGAFRALNTPYPNNQVDPDFVLAALKIFGGKVEVDGSNERRAKDIASERARQLLNFADNLGRNITAAFFNAVSSATSFAGLKAIMPSGQVLTPAENGFEVVAGNDNTAKRSKEVFLEKLHELMAKIAGGPDVLYMNSTVLNRLTTIAADMVKYEKNEFGVLVPYFKYIPIRDPGFDSLGANILGNDEACGTSSNTASVFGVKWGEAKNLSLATSTGLSVEDLGKVGVHYVHNVEMDIVPVLQNDKAVAKLSGIIVT